jgi:cyclic pyranopterin phosphate synthase
MELPSSPDAIDPHNADVKDLKRRRPPESFDILDVTDVLWTLTNRCNLRCIYCHAIPHARTLEPEPTGTQIDHVLQQLRLLPALQSLIVSGGEALISPHVERVLQQAEAIAPVCYVITNGTVLGQRQKQLLRAYHPRTMVSVDSIDETKNTTTRGPGVLRKSLDSIKWLLDSGIYTIVIIVLTRSNCDGIQNTIESLYETGVRNILVQQLHCTTAAMQDSFIELSPPSRGDSKPIHVD